MHHGRAREQVDHVVREQPDELAPHHAQPRDFPVSSPLAGDAEGGAGDEAARGQSERAAAAVGGDPARAGGEDARRDECLVKGWPKRQRNHENEGTLPPEMAQSHYQLVAFDFLKNNYSKEQVEQLESYLKPERSLSKRSHKRYITMSSKRPRPVEVSVPYVEDGVSKIPSITLDPRFAQKPMKPEAVEGVMNSNMLEIETAGPAVAPVVMPIDSRTF